MDFVIKLAVVNAIIIFCVQAGRQLPSLAGLIATMPLTGLIVMVWLHCNQPQNNTLMLDYTRGVVWGILPTILFFITALVCFKRELPFGLLLSISFGIWIIGAMLHQWLLH